MKPGGCCSRVITRQIGIVESTRIGLDWMGCNGMQWDAIGLTLIGFAEWARSQLLIAPVGVGSVEHVIGPMSKDRANKNKAFQQAVLQ